MSMTANSGGVERGVKCQSDGATRPQGDSPALNGSHDGGTESFASASQSQAEQDEPGRAPAAILCAFDLETTGLDTQYAKIVEISVICDGDEFHSPVNPGIPIPPEATEIHGIADADVKDAPIFPAIAERVQAMVQGAVLVGYSIRSFDTLILHRELSEAGQAAFDLDEVRELDCYRVWQEAEPRTLVGALKRFCGIDHEDAHSALSDTEAMGPLVHGMQQAFGLSVEQMVAMSKPANELDRSGKFVRADNGEVLFNFSDHKGKPALSEPGMLEWMLRKDFPSGSKAVARRLLNGEKV